MKTTLLMSVIALVSSPVSAHQTPIMESTHVFEHGVILCAVLAVSVTVTWGLLRNRRMEVKSKSKLRK